MSDMSLFNNDEGETIIEYPNGRTATLAHADATEPQFTQHDTEPQLQPWAETLEVLPDPFPGVSECVRAILGEHVTEDNSLLKSKTLQYTMGIDGGRTAAPYAAELEHLRANRKIEGKDYNWSSLTINLPPTSLEALANKFDASPQATTDATHAAHDALLAIVRLRAACEQMIDSETPINAEECLTFVEFAKQRLNVVATAAPLLKAGK